MMMSLAISVPVAVLFVSLGLQLIHLWVGQSVNPSLWLLFGLGACKVIESVCYALSMFLNGTSIIRPQAYAGASFAIVSTMLKIWFVFRFGIVGAPWGTLVALVACAVIPYSILAVHTKALSVRHVEANAQIA
jgi:O-antigen/teichoic acid export membrane protein